MSKKIKLFVDSSSTIDDIFFKNNDIGIIPLSLSDSNEKVYDDAPESLSKDDLIKKMDLGLNFKTSSTPFGKLSLAIEEALETHDEVIFLPISSGLSSQYSQSKLIENDFPNRFFIVKSETAAYGNEFIAKNIVEYIKQGLSSKEIVKKAEDLNMYVNSYFSCENVTSLISGGRITKGILKIIQILKFKPIILFDNKNQSAGWGRNYKDIIKKIINLIKKDYSEPLTSQNIDSICLYVSGYEKEKKEFLLDYISEYLNYPKKKIITRWVPNIILSHARKGAYGITICTKIPHRKRDVKDN